MDRGAVTEAEPEPVPRRDGGRGHLRAVDAASSSAGEVTAPTHDAPASRYAVAMLAVPPVFVLLAYTAPRLVLSPWPVAVAVVVTVGLGWADTLTLRRAGVRMGLGEAAFVGVFYLLARSRRTRSGLWLPLAWLLSLAATLVALHSFAAVHSLDGAAVEHRLEAWAAQHGAARSTVTCPDRVTGRAGSVVSCSARAPGGRRGVFDVTLHASGYSWALRVTSS